jgi:beta-glucosidase
MSINAGLDMIMIPKAPEDPNNYVEFIKDVKELVAEGKIKMERIDDAVRRILRVKLEMNLQEHPYTDKSLLAKVGSIEHREVARQCVQQSLVLLKNQDKTLPLSKEIKTLLVAGSGADNIGMQCGGWTISWQGVLGNDVTTGGTTILQGIKNTVSKTTKVIYSQDGSQGEGVQAAIVVVGESPYAEMKGDKEDLSLSKEDEALIEKLKAKGIPVITLLLSGRPMIINKALENSMAFVAAWLPGTEGEGVADVLFGAKKPVGKLSVTWPKDMKQIPINIGDKEYNPLFKYGYGLTY